MWSVSLHTSGRSFGYDVAFQLEVSQQCICEVLPGGSSAKGTLGRVSCEERGSLVTANCIVATLLTKTLWYGLLQLGSLPSVSSACVCIRLIRTTRLHSTIRVLQCDAEKCMQRACLECGGFKPTSPFGTQQQMRLCI